MLPMSFNRTINIVIIAFMLIMTVSCRSKSPIQYADYDSDVAMIKKIEQQFKFWQKTPYRYGGNNLQGIDCSALIENFYNQNVNILMPRTTVEQAKIGSEVTKLKAGDLVFFKTGQGNSGLHVGIYYKNGQFLHVSTSKGVQFASLDNLYWKEHYWLAKRLIG